MPGHEVAPSLDEFIAEARIQGRCVYSRKVQSELRKKIAARVEADERFNAWAACAKWLEASGVKGVENHHIREHYRRGHEDDA